MQAILNLCRIGQELLIGWHLGLWCKAVPDGFPDVEAKEDALLLIGEQCTPWAAQLFR